MERRKYLATLVGAGGIVLAGCSEEDPGEKTGVSMDNESDGSDGDDGDNAGSDGSDGDDGSDEGDGTSEPVITVVGHDFNYPEFGDGVDFEVTVENGTDEAQDIHVAIEVYDDEFVIANNPVLLDIPPNATGSGDAYLADLVNVDDVTHYIIRMGVGFGGNLEKLGEFDGDTLRSKLGE